MDKIGKLSTITFELFGQVITLNSTMIMMTYVVIVFLALSAYLATRRLKQVPNTTQNLFEVIYEFIEEVTLGTLGNKDGKSFVPLIFSIFVFVLAANWIGILPHITTFFGFIIAIVHHLFTGDAGQWVLDGITKTTFIPNQQTFIIGLSMVLLNRTSRISNCAFAIQYLICVVNISKKSKVKFIED